MPAILLASIESRKARSMSADIKFSKTIVNDQTTCFKQSIYTGVNLFTLALGVLASCIFRCIITVYGYPQAKVETFNT